jgi:hypothetical protein
MQLSGANNENAQMEMQLNASQEKVGMQKALKRSLS